MSSPSTIPNVDHRDQLPQKDLLTGLPGLLVKEWHRTFNWTVVIALVLVINAFRTTFEMLGAVQKIAEFSGEDVVVVIVVTTIVGCVLAGALWWAAWRMLRYLAAIIRLRQDSAPEQVEEVFLRQRRLWVALTAAAAGHLAATAIAAPLMVDEGRERAAEMQSLEEGFRTRNEEYPQEEEKWDQQREEAKRKDAEEAHEELGRKARVKKLEEEYWKSKQAQ